MKVRFPSLAVLAVVAALVALVGMGPFSLHRVSFDHSAIGG